MSEGTVGGRAVRKRNPFVSSARGGRTLSALQLPFFWVWPPAGYSVITTTGRKTGKSRRRCIRAIRRGDKVYVVNTRGGTIPGWMKNVLANPEVRLRLRGGSVSGVARKVRGTAEEQRAREAYCRTVTPFDYLTFVNYRKGRPSSARIRALFEEWFESGIPFVIELNQ